MEAGVTRQFPSEPFSIGYSNFQKFLGSDVPTSTFFWEPTNSSTWLAAQNHCSRAVSAHKSPCLHLTLPVLLDETGEVVHLLQGNPQKHVTASDWCAVQQWGPGNLLASPTDSLVGILVWTWEYVLWLVSFLPTTHVLSLWSGFLLRFLKPLGVSVEFLDVFFCYRKECYFVLKQHFYLSEAFYVYRQQTP